MSQPSFSRFDSVATRILLLLALVGTAVFSLVLPALDWARGRALTAVVDTGLGGTLQLDSAIPRPDVGVSWPGTARVRLADPPGGVWAWQIAVGAVLTLAVGVVAVLLTVLLDRIQHDRQFTPSSVRLLRGVGGTIIAGAVAVTALGSIADAEIVAAAFREREAPISLTLLSAPTVVALVTGLVFAALAEVFARAQRLREDVEGLV